MIAPKGPVALPKRPGRLKMPAPTMEPTTIASERGEETVSRISMSGSRFFPIPGGFSNRYLIVQS